jgi:hypothetical protein
LSDDSASLDSEDKEEEIKLRSEISSKKKSSLKKKAFDDDDEDFVGVDDDEEELRFEGESKSKKRGKGSAPKRVAGTQKQTASQKKSALKGRPVKLILNYVFLLPQ